MTEVAHKSRIEWIDAMRGFTMILVVAFHVCQQAFAVDIKQSASLPFLVLFRMPLFFFISGFVAYKSSITWTAHEYTTLLAKKARVQLIPTLVFFLVAVVILAPNRMGDYIMTDLHTPTGFYWFTIALFYMLAAYYTYCFIISRLTKRIGLAICILWILSVAMYETVYLPKIFDYAFGNPHAKEGFLIDSKIIQFMQYFQFFLYGNIVRRYWEKAQQLFDNKYVILTIIGIAFFSCIDFLKLHLLSGQWTNLSRTLAMYSMLTIVFLFFRYYKDSVTKQTKLGNILQYIGTRTLDIYLLHKLFMPNLHCIGEFFNNNHHNFVAETTLSIMLALIIIAFCILVSNTLRMSPFLKKYLFGR